MQLNVNGIIYYIDDVYVSNSQYLSILVNSKSNVEYYIDEDGIKTYVIEEDWLDSDDFMNYLKLISLELDHDVYVSGELLDFMGHFNTLHYPNEFWNVKIQDNIIRDKFYTYPWILENNYFALEDITHMINKNRARYVRNTMEGYDENIYIAGGAALYIAGIIDDTRDIDIFTTDRKSIGNILRSHDYVYILDNCIMYKTTTQTDNKTYAYSKGSFTTIQIITREYSTASEIVHGFDLDCCGYIYHPYSEKLYRTRRSRFSTEYKTNFFDPARSSPSYPIRLSKYYMRGFNIWMPFEDRVVFNEEVYVEYLDKLLDIDIIHDYHEYFGGHQQTMILKPFSITENDIRRLETMINKYEISRLDANTFIIDYRNSGLELGEFLKIRLSSLLSNPMNKILPHDPVSVIYLMKMKNVYISSMDVESDYAKYGSPDIYIQFKDIKPEWKTMNPMEQTLTGTFYPEPIEIDMLEWYKQSPLIIINDMLTD